jgi:hypothetical protein
MEYGKWLIDKAAELCGSRYALAKQLGVDEGNLSRYAKKGPPIEWVPRLAEIAGVEPGQAVLRVLAERVDAKKPPLRVAGFAHVSALGYTMCGAAVVSLTPEFLTRVIAWLHTMNIVSASDRYSRPRGICSPHAAA